MKTAMIAPRRYVQGKGVLSETGSLLAAMGKKPLFLWDARVKAVVGPAIVAALKDANLDAAEVEFGGQ
ncbi:MAG: glycerol dehydrogenase, partial [Verrucomicrobia bacterium]|nr:glycerol dehydrogenase [Verrucomicrobiota bacterium]